MVEKKEGDVPKISPEAKKKLEDIRKKLDTFKKQVLAKFSEYIMCIGLLPPSEEDREKKEINVIVLVNDTDSKKMSKMELKQKLSVIIERLGKEVDPNLNPNTVILTELWEDCYDGRYQLLDGLAMSAPVYDKGTLGALKITSLHRSMVMKKFEKYIVTYILWGSIARGDAHPDSDIDVAIIVDDTDVKRMTRTELKDKLRSIIISMGLEAGEMTGIRNKLNINTYILTEFWELTREANPVIFTLLRDGVPLYDRGVFMPWKHLLKMGRITPSPEAIDIFRSSGDKMVSTIKRKLMSIAEVDIYWSTLNPTQAALMLYGIAPPTPAETIRVMNEIFVEKEKLLEKSYVDIMRKIRDYYKGLEHGEIREVSGKEIDQLLADADKYLKRINRLFEQISKLKAEENLLEIYNNTKTIVRDILNVEGVKEARAEQMMDLFKSHIIDKGKIPDKFLEILKEIFNAKKDYDEGNLTRTDIMKIRKDFRLFVNTLVEYMQRKRGYELERSRIRVKHGDKFGEVILLDDHAFIIYDIDSKEKEVMKAKINKDGSLGKEEKSSLQDMEQAIAGVEIPKKTFIKEPIFEDLRKIFGRNVEIQLNN
ncbi:nucleotidyltransferase domain-containing protein [Candidatus Woesearchaeota archaeon]|nr:nucleotidyltransferase domain-containing protein [Candidatus Woesearchaeota archaeon]